MTDFIDKKWYKSKTLWFNILAIVVILAKSTIGFEINGDEQAAIVIVGNMLVRLFTTVGIVKSIR